MFFFSWCNLWTNISKDKKYIVLMMISSNQDKNILIKYMLILNLWPWWINTNKRAITSKLKIRGKIFPWNLLGWRKLWLLISALIKFRSIWSIGKAISICSKCSPRRSTASFKSARARNFWKELSIPLTSSTWPVTPKKTTQVMKNTLPTK